MANLSTAEWGLRNNSIQNQFNTAGEMGQLSNSLLDFMSPFYQQYASYLQKNTPGIGANTLLAPLMAGGTGYAGGQAIAMQQAKAMQRQRQDGINSGVQGFALGNINIGAGLLGQQANAYGNIFSQLEQTRQFEKNLKSQSGSFWDQLLNIGGMFGGNAMGSLLSAGGSAAGGSAIASSATAAAALSDIRFKENISKIGISEKGVNIYEFNYRGNSKRYIGAMAHENPEASINIDGVLYLDYSKLDVKFMEV